VREDWKPFVTSAGVELRYGPFVAGMYHEIVARALELHPDPQVPRKSVDTFDGPEDVDDPDEPGYKAALQAARLARASFLGEAALDLCVEVVDWDAWRAQAERLARYVPGGKPPDDEQDLKVWFLARYALRTGDDWNLIRRIQSFSQIEDEEVRRRVEFFRRDVAGAEGAGADAPGGAA